MSNTSRVDQALFENNHYLGKPADNSDKIIARRINILKSYPSFFDRNLDLIEVGCGPGTTINQIANEFHNCLGIDVFDYKQPYEDYAAKCQIKNSRFQSIDLEKELPGEKFDRLISFEVIEHFKHEETVIHFNTLLRKGGLAAISVPNKWWIFETHGARLPLLPWNRVPFFSWLPKRIHEKFANARIYTKKRITQLLRGAGFEVIVCEYITAPLDVLKESRVKKMLVKNIFKHDITKNPFLSTSIFVLAKKVN